MNSLFRSGLAASRGLARPSTRAIVGQRFNSTNPLKVMYNTVWKSNITYITYILAGCVALETVYGGATEFVWEQANKGKLYHQVDWSKFQEEDEEEEEEDEE
ncbi:unnamed protein product [Heterosigma akashiwo]|mmetsp:Transcript_20854/g.32917  ORF Transcript_20854/g.32917 Transcript_20854/m.32917 type:complete len:102 (-) Transcript_20854:247-552(-)